MEAPAAPPPVPLHENHVPTDLICSICMTVPAEPLITPCNHLFCQKCIRQSLDDKYLCPIDRHPCSPHELRPLDGLSFRVWGGIQVKCGYHENGCAWSGSVADYSAHLTDNCSASKNPTVRNNFVVVEEMQRLKIELESVQQDNTRNAEIAEQAQADLEGIQDELRSTQRELAVARKKFEITNLLLEDLQMMPRFANGGDEDIEIVQRHTACPRSDAARALRENDNKVYSAIMSFTDTDYMKDIDLVMSQADCSRRDAINALLENGLNSAKAVYSLTVPGYHSYAPSDELPQEPPPEEDIDLVMRQAGCSRTDAIKALSENYNDLINAIISLTT